MVIRVEDLPAWWTESGVFAFIESLGYLPGFWNWFWSAFLIVATQVQFKKAPRAKTVRPHVLMATMLFFQFLFMFLGVAMLDGGMMFHYGSAFWGVIALGYAWLMWAWRIHLRRKAVEDRRT